MTDKIEGLPVSGYKPQSPEAVALVNEFKADEERLLRKLDALVASPVRVASGGTLVPGSWVEVEINTGPEVDKRWLAIARTGFEQAFMALNRSVFQPGRIRLPEDDDK
jgi:hypothetical protein